MSDLPDGPPAAIEPPLVPGYRLWERLGGGSFGEVWSASGVESRRRVAVKVPYAGSPPASAELAVLRGLRHPHVVRLFDDVALADGRTALVLELVGGGSLARVVAARGHLTPGEAVTVLVALAGTLQDLLMVGVTHGDLTPANVLLHRDGRPMLADVGLARVAGQAGQAAPDSIGDPTATLDLARGEVAELGALGWFCLVGSAPGPATTRGRLVDRSPGVPGQLAAAIESALHPDPRERPTFADLARAVHLAAPPEPIRLAGDHDPVSDLTHRIRRLAAGDQPPALQAGRRWWAGRRIPASWRRDAWPEVQLGRLRTLVAVVGGALCLLAGLAAAAVPTPRAAVPATGRQATVTAASVSWADVVQGLSSARTQAFSAAPVTGPDGFDARGSSAWTSDRQSLDALRAAGLHYRGLSLSAADVRVRSATSGRVEVTVMMRTSAYEVVDGSGHLVGRRAASPARSTRLNLVATPAGWRVVATV